MSRHSSRTRRYQQMRLEVIAASGGICRLCHKPMRPWDVEIDHIIPKVYGGPDVYENMRAVHRDCNRKRGAELEPSRASRRW